jgi:hypothetical protein
MYSMYIIIENGEAYATAYIKYESAVAAVKEKHKTYIEEQIKDLAYLEDIESMLKDINVPENTSTGISQLYIEKGINIIIQKTPIV